jgi:hypothetical protein
VDGVLQKITGNTAAECAACVYQEQGLLLDAR